MIKILAIGNSFSEDATAYLADMASSDGINIKVVNLYIGGCSLKTHWSNIQENKADYEYQLNGIATGNKISIEEALQEEEWDYITLQQASHDSGILESYYPYIRDVSNYVEDKCPKAKQLIHQTWAYEIDSTHEGFVRYERDQMKMYLSLTHAYESVAKELNLGIIPSGYVIQKLRKLEFFDYKNGGTSLCRDGFHMNLIYGRYALAATWYQFIIDKPILSNKFLPDTNKENELNKEVIQLIRDNIQEIYQKFMHNHKIIGLSINII